MKEKDAKFESELVQLYDQQGKLLELLKAERAKHEKVLRDLDDKSAAPAQPASCFATFHFLLGSIAITPFQWYGFQNLSEAHSRLVRRRFL